jgi:hypothetical protein
MATSTRIALLLLCFAACRSDGLDPSRDGSVPDGGSGDGGGDLGQVTGCKGLDEQSCRHASGCVADTCELCSCTPSFVGCRAINEGRMPCPELGCAQPLCCRTSDECQPSHGGTCQVPPINAGCGACFIGPSECDDDADCKSNGQSWICKEAPCSCGDALINSCQQGCSSDADCHEPDRCNTATYRCEPRACGDPACTGNYECGGASCVRKSCTKDAQCDAGGYCVDGACSRSLGQCIQPAA